MKCPQCQHDMVQSKSGMLCLNCGYVQKPEVLADAAIHSTQTNAGGLAKNSVIAHSVSGLVTPKPADDEKPADKPAVSDAEPKSDNKSETQADDKPEAQTDNKSEAKPVDDEEPKLNRHHKTKRSRPVDSLAGETGDKPVSVEQSKPELKSTGELKLDITPGLTPEVPEAKESASADDPKTEPEPAEAEKPLVVDGPSESIAESKPDSEPIEPPAVKPAAPWEDPSASSDEAAKSDEADKEPEPVTVDEPIKMPEVPVIPVVSDNEEDASSSKEASDKPEPESKDETSQPKEPAEEEPLPAALETSGDGLKTEAVADEPEPAAEPESKPESEPASEPAKQPNFPGEGSETKPDPVMDSVQAPAPVPAPVADTAAAPAKPPVTPVTHPKRSFPLGAVIGLVAIVLVVAAVAVYYLVPHSSLPFLGSAQTTSTPSPDASKEASATTQATATPTATPTASPAAVGTPAAGNAATHDAQRQSDLAKYVAAYKATASNGYYPTNPPAVSVAATDPSTNQAYQVITTAPSTLGQVRYDAGGQCGGAGITPGKGSTHYVSLTTKLENGSTYCLDVK